MDLEIIGKKMLEALAIRGKIASMQTELLDLQGEIAKADGEIRESQEAKAVNLEALEQARIAWDGALADAEDAQQQVKTAIARRKSAELLVERAEEEVGKYGDAVFEHLAEVTQKVQGDKQAIEAEMVVALKELEGLKKDLEERQAELKASGVELNLVGTAPRPKVTTL